MKPPRKPHKDTERLDWLLGGGEQDVVIYYFKDDHSEARDIKSRKDIDAAMASRAGKK